MSDQVFIAEVSEYPAGGGSVTATRFIQGATAAQVRGHILKVLSIRKATVRDMLLTSGADGVPIEQVGSNGAEPVREVTTTG